jgi:ribosomal protein S12 methylthiotransferase
MPKIAVISLGCAKNLVDTEIMLGQFVRGQWQITRDFAEADLILINTCGFIQTAKQESINFILEMIQYKNPDKGQCSQLVVAGCLVQRYALELAREIPEVDHWIGLGGIGAVLHLIKDPAKKLPRINDAPFINNENLPRHQVTLPHTTYIKIAEGCDHCCSYCAIPLIKGKYRSRNPQAIVKEVSDLVATGVREINLIAQDITGYGHDLPVKTSLRSLLEEIIATGNPHWIRLLYAHPTGISTELLEFIAKEPKICKYLDLPLQHINPRLLKMMNRPGSRERIREIITKIKTVVPGIVIRTTFIAGFPSESELEFRELLDFVSEGYFEHVGVFTYSIEEGTSAYWLRPQIKESIKKERQKRLLQAQQQVSARFLASLKGSCFEILIDRVESNGSAIGRTQFLAPEVDGVVYVKGFKGKPGCFIQGVIVDSDPYNLWGEVTG